VHELNQGSAGQAPARTGTPSTGADAEMARVDAQLELAAKKAALAGMQRAAQGGGADAQAPALPATGGTVTIEKDGKTITLENPTAEQLAAATSSGTAQRAGLEGWQLVAVTGTVVWGIVAVLWMFLSHRRRSHGVGTLANAQTDARMARIENAIESVAVEVERISEGQRFTSRLLAEGAAVPVSVADRAASVLQNRGDV
jgi:hypothetical protein